MVTQDKGEGPVAELTDITENSAIFVGTLYLADIYRKKEIQDITTK